MEIQSQNPITMVECGNNMTVVLTSNNEFYYSGQLCFTMTTNEFKKIEFSLPENDEVIDFKCGGSHVILFTQLGRVYGFGSNGMNQMGLPSTMKEVERPTLIKVELSKKDKIKAVSCGQFHSLILTEKGIVNAAGYNAYGNIGLGEEEFIESFTKIPNLPSIGEDEIDWGYELRGISGAEIVDRIFAGANHSVFITNCGTIWVCGLNKMNQLGEIIENESQLSKKKKRDSSHDQTKVKRVHKMELKTNPASTELEVFIGCTSNNSIFMQHMLMSRFMYQSLKSRSSDHKLYDLSIKFVSL